MKLFYLILLSAVFSFFCSSQNLGQTAFAKDTELSIKLIHDNVSDLKICIKSEYYETLCKDFEFKEILTNPYSYIIEVDDKKNGKTFQLCYENEVVDGCKEMEFNDSEVQRIDLTIEGSSVTISEDKTFDYGIPEIPSNSNSPFKVNSQDNTDDDVPPIPSKGTDDDVPPIP